MQGATPIINGINLTAAGKRLSAQLKSLWPLQPELRGGHEEREKEKASVLSICLDMKPLYVPEVAVKLYPVGYVTP